MMMDEIINLIKIIDEIGSLSNMKFEIEKLYDMKAALMCYSKFKVGEHVKLLETPIINSNVSWGWIGYRNILVKDSIALVKSVEWSGGFKYMLEFMENCKPIGDFCFSEKLLYKGDPDDERHSQ